MKCNISRIVHKGGNCNAVTVHVCAFNNYNCPQHIARDILVEFHGGDIIPRKRLGLNESSSPLNDAHMCTADII